MIRRLQSLIAGIFSLFPSRLFTCFWKSDQHLPSLFSIDFKNASCADFLAGSSCLDSCLSFSVQCTPNFLLLYSSLTFDFNRLISEFFLSVLCGTKRSILSYTIFLKLFRISSTLLPLLAHTTNLSRRKICKPETSVLL